jgi:hypothetical protein
MSDRYVRVTDCSIGDDSPSGLAFSCRIDGEHFWVPYSQVRKRTVNSKIVGADSFEVATWWADKNEVDGDPC